AIYLLSFIVTFGGERFYPHRVMRILFVPAVLTLAALVPNNLVLLGIGHWRLSLVTQVSLYSVTLFIICLVCHGELYRIRPPAGQLTAFYLSISGGGALGGAFVSLLAPALFPFYIEHRIGLIICSLTLLLLVARRPAAVVAGLVAVAALAAYEFQIERIPLKTAFHWERSFYGVLSLHAEGSTPQDRRIMLRNGNVRHGFQYLDPALRDQPTVYFHARSGVGLAFRHVPRRGPMHVAVLGLGVGTLAAYAQPGDTHRYYELNPAVTALAFNQDVFQYLGAARARGANISVATGDGRLMLERDLADGTVQPGSLDLFVLDAFTSDSIPVHLLTMEAFELYRRALRPDGLIAVHISNKHLDLSPLLFATGERMGWRVCLVVTPSLPEMGAEYCRWVLMTNNREFFAQPEVQQTALALPGAKMRPWTDDFSNLFSVWN
ncbi:MAG TPA: hypothetical protein VIH35_00255, partial [Kiritimatiellia bacterium]